MQFDGRTINVGAAVNHRRNPGTTAILNGDSSFDIRAAKAAGVPNVVLSFGYHDIPVAEMGADVVIDHYEQLVPALAKL